MTDRDISKPSKASTKLVRLSSVEVVAQELRRRILSGELPAGAQLLQVQLGEELGVSRIPIREALRQLESEGLVTIQSHKGGIVSVLSAEEITELFEIRAKLEGWLLSVAVPRMTDRHFDEAQSALDEMPSGEVEHWGELNQRFHEALFKAANKSACVKMVRQLHRNTDRYVRMHIRMTEGWVRATREHRAILELCRAREAKRAAGALEKHILSAASELVKHMERVSES